MMLIIADSHVAEGGPSEDDFFAMLDAISRTDCDVLFLGDNLDIWIASAPKYETALHARFLDWCRREKQRRRVILVEGNHEFYVCRHHADAFTECTETVFRENGRSFVHGDMTQAPTGFHRIFRAISKNRVGDAIMAWMPWGVPFAKWMKRLLAHDTWHHADKPAKRDRIPFEHVDRWVAGECAKYPTSLVIMGHFHQAAERAIDGTDIRYVIVPAWKYDQEIARLDEASAKMTTANWHQILDAPDTSQTQSDINGNAQ